jgi:hypothetical protein
MRACLTEESRFGRSDVSIRVKGTVAKLERSKLVLVALLILASVVSANANGLSVGAIKIAAIEGVPSIELGSETVEQVRLNIAESNSISPVQVAGIVASGPNAGTSELLQSQQIIATLSATVESLSQQLSRKDQQIEFLQKQIDEFERYIGDNASTEPLALLDGHPFWSSEVENLSINDPEVKQANLWWQWALLCFFALSSSAYLMRARIYTLGQSLNLIGSKHHLESNSVAEQRPADGTSLADGSHQAIQVSSVEVNAAIEAIEAIDDLSFDQRFEQLLDEKDFAFARELLDFTRYNEINDERYHCERLRLLEKMQDEDGFYAYYYGIESKIPTFPENLQTQISQLVVMLAKAKFT